MSLALVLLPFLLQDPELDALLEKLRTEDAVERRRIQVELLRRGKEAVPAMLAALERSSPRPQEEVARLVARLGSASWKERNEATQSLVRLGRAAVPLLEARLKGAEPEAAWRMKAALAEIQEKAGSDDHLEQLRAATLCDVLGQSADPRAAGPLIRLLGAAPAEQRLDLKRRAAEALGRLRGAMSEAEAEAAADLVVQLIERTPGTLEKGLLVKTLGRLGIPTSTRPIAALLADRSEKNVHLKRCCVAALAAIGRPHALRAVVEALGADDVYVRQAALEVLAERAGEDFGFDPRAGAEENRAAVEKFRAWGAAKFGKDWDRHP